MNQDALDLIDERLTVWGQAGRNLIGADEVVDLALDLRNLLLKASDVPRDGTRAAEPVPAAH
ncbi:MAG: hypothetical protein GY882_10570 [Actinomycetia bacterium]|jgi:hypothetical protein|nr:hypothetical protein [Actinomycetes bacterium]MCP4845379.1 hypothetical protein [Actinomycetes bacterium]